MDQLAKALWRKSSYSGGNGGACVEVGAMWRKSSHSGGNGGNCIEVAGGWTKSTFSGGNGEGCVEVASHRPNTVAVRDSKDREGPQLAFPAPAWSQFVAGIKGGEFDLL
jgi:hypothetical protein